MLINDRYHDQFKKWVRDMKDADIDWQAGRYLIERKLLANEISNMSAAILTPAVLGLAFALKGVVESVRSRGISEASLFFLVGGGAIFAAGVGAVIYANNSHRKIDRINEAANYQRRTLGEHSTRPGTYQRGASRTCNLDQL